MAENGGKLRINSGEGSPREGGVSPSSVRLSSIPAKCSRIGWVAGRRPCAVRPR